MSRRSNINPFYALVVVTGAAFAVTTLAYVVALVVAESPRNGGSNAVTESSVLRFFEQRGETIMLWEAGVLAVAAVLAMGLDRWRTMSSCDPHAAGQDLPRDTAPRE